MRPALALIACLILTAEALPAMTPPTHHAPQALSLKVERRDGKLDIALFGHAAQVLEVSYLLEVSGASTSRHRGKTTLAADTPVRLSRMTTDEAENWCVRLLAEEVGREPYEIRQGPCLDREG